MYLTDFIFMDISIPSHSSVWLSKFKCQWSYWTVFWSQNILHVITGHSITTLWLLNFRKYNVYAGYRCGHECTCTCTPSVYVRFVLSSYVILNTLSGISISEPLARRFFKFFWGDMLGTVWTNQRCVDMPKIAIAILLQDKLSRILHGISNFTCYIHILTFIVAY